MPKSYVLIYEAPKDAHYKRILVSEDELTVVLVRRNNTLGILTFSTEEQFMQRTMFFKHWDNQTWKFGKLIGIDIANIFELAMRQL